MKTFILALTLMSLNAAATLPDCPPGAQIQETCGGEISQCISRCNDCGAGMFTNEAFQLECQDGRWVTRPPDVVGACYLAYNCMGNVIYNNVPTDFCINAGGHSIKQNICYNF